MLNDTDPKRVKDVLQAMIDGIRVDARDQIEPTFTYLRFALSRVTWSCLGTIRTTIYRGRCAVWPG